MAVFLIEMSLILVADHEHFLFSDLEYCPL